MSKSGNDGLEILCISLLELHWNNEHLNTNEGYQGDTPWKAELIQNSTERVENLPLTSAHTVCKALIFHYKHGLLFLYFVISYLILEITQSDKAPNI